MNHSDPIRGACVLITGAASGMGAIYARKAAAAGAAKLVLLDVNAKALAAFAGELAAQNGVCRVYPVTADLSDQAALALAAAQVRESAGEPDILINNAGIVFSGAFWRHSEAQIGLTMAVNTLAPMLLTQAFLPQMLADNTRLKRILNVASAAGTLANPNMSVYAASKWALIGWSESLRLELAQQGFRHIRVTTFCPSYVSTGMFEGARGPLLTPILTPEAAAGAAWQGMLDGRALVLRPWTVKLAMALRGVLPVAWWDWVAGKVFKVYSSMDDFTGRN